MFTITITTIIIKILINLYNCIKYNVIYFIIETNFRTTKKNLILRTLTLTV